MGKIDLETAPSGKGTRYPAPHDAPCKERTWKKLGDAAGLTQVGVNLVTLKPGVWSSQRHWHSHEEEFVWVLEGELVMVTDAGEEIVSATATICRTAQIVTLCFSSWAHAAMTIGASTLTST
jgi:uncharacterized cupin superfamily protein